MGILSGFGMDSATLAGPLEARLQAMAGAGFTQCTLDARDIASHPGGVDAALRAVQASGLVPAGLRALRDFEGLSGHLHAYKVDMAKALLEMCQALGKPVLVACATVAPPASTDAATLARDLRKLAMLALPLGIQVAYRAQGSARSIRSFSAAWDVVCEADCPNLGLGLDAFPILGDADALDALEDLDPSRIFGVELSDRLWDAGAGAPSEGLQVFPGEGEHGEALAELVLRLDAIGYRGDYHFGVDSADYRQLPAATVAARARRSALWLREDVLRRSAPLPLGAGLSRA